MLAPLVAVLMMQLEVPDPEGSPLAAVEAAGVNLEDNDGARFGVSLVGAGYGLSIALGLGAAASAVTLLLYAKGNERPDLLVILGVGLVVAGLAAPLSIPLMASAQHSGERGRGTVGAAFIGSLVGCLGAAALGVGAYVMRERQVEMGLMIVSAVVTALAAPVVALELSHWGHVNAGVSVAPLRDGAAASFQMRF